MSAPVSGPAGRTGGREAHPSSATAIESDTGGARAPTAAGAGRPRGTVRNARWGAWRLGAPHPTPHSFGGYRGVRCGDCAPPPPTHSPPARAATRARVRARPHRECVGDEVKMQNYVAQHDCNCTFNHSYNSRIYTYRNIHGNYISVRKLPIRPSGERPMELERPASWGLRRVIVRCARGVRVRRARTARCDAAAPHVTPAKHARRRSAQGKRWCMSPTRARTIATFTITARGRGTGPSCSRLGSTGT